MAPLRDSQSTYEPTTAPPTTPPPHYRPQSDISDDLHERPFQYSTAGPPTVYSELETAWSQPTRAQLSPGQSLPSAQRTPIAYHDSPFGGIEEEGEDDDLYHRSDWEDHDNPKTTATPWSRSSWAGPTTGGTGISRWGGGTTLGRVQEGQEWIPPVPSRASAPALPPNRSQEQDVVYAYEQNGIMESPGMMTPHDVGRYSGSSPHYRSSPQRVSQFIEQDRRAIERQRDSTLPSIVDLQDLVRPKVSSSSSKSIVSPGSAGSDPPIQQMQQAQKPAITRRGPYTYETTPDANNTWKTNRVSGGSPKLMSPEAQQRLGRMSMATARYTLPPQRLGGSEFGPHGTRKASTSVPFMARSKIGVLYLSYRPFIAPLLTLTCALMLTITNSTSTSSISQFLKIGLGVFKGSQGGGTGAGNGITLGAWGWCQSGVSDPQCESYSRGDFKNKSGSFTIPGDTSLDNLSSLLTSLTALTWLLAAYQIITAFLHFYLFFSLSIPFSHLVTIPKDEVAKAEVDLRVKLDRQNDPWGEELREMGESGNEGGGWVWWAWWAHRRSPLGCFFGFLVGSLSMSTLALTFLFKKAVRNGTNSDDVHYGSGTYVPLITLMVTLDTFMFSMWYLISIRSNLSTFFEPPDPSPTALLLPPSEARRMHHVRDHNGASFFAPRSTHAVPDTANIGDGNGTKSMFYDPNAPPLPVAAQTPRTEELDPETVRWLAAYPSDEELVPLISDLRMGKLSDDFLLSEVGLLYLRPLVEGEEGQALLVPPKGAIRQELVEDSHLDPSPFGEENDAVGGVAHNGAEVMAVTLQQTFWWTSLPSDCYAHISKCPVCRQRQEEAEAMERRERMEEKAGMTAVPWTGITGWTARETEAGGGVGESAMAVEMAYAMRKAEEEANTL
ncbi:hypothetical protein B9479_005096 [Cryptococcus floricola]|uniref:Uncharacterized protein n=1 Tax=Cryptococcus floricola TaxID=2591691 RepID=A0A5D3AVI3_9TREE|nr:hypothetical protein B9479_005096 [Cryptococcus floricola]